MLEPISALFASSFSRKGIKDADTDTNWFGDTSINFTSSGATISNSPPTRADTVELMKFPSTSKVALAWAMGSSFSSKALKC